MELSIASILAESAARHPDRAAVVLGESRVTYAELWEQARRYAAVLRAHGIGPGDAVALMLPNVPDFPRTYYGALALGAVVVPVHALLTAEEIAFVLADARVKAFVCAAPFLAAGRAAAEKAGVTLLAVMVPPPGPGEPGPQVPQLDAFAASADPITAFVRRGPLDDAVVLY
ncbi:MAG: AMP-binding protein, partial [Vulcanimicrobiaceae bacterium]